MSAPGPRGQVDLERQTALYILFRLLLGLAILAFAWHVARDEPLRLLNHRVLFQLGIYAFAIMLLSALVVSKLATRMWFRFAQLLFDALLVSALVLLLGGLDSPFFSLYPMNIIAAAWLLPRWGAIVVAALDVAVFIATGVFYLSLASDHSGLAPAVYGAFVVRVFALMLVGLLSGQIAERLSAARTRLAREVSIRENLQAEHSVVLDQVPSGVLIVGPDGRIATANPVAVRVLGEVVGKVLQEVLPGLSQHSQQMYQKPGFHLICSRSSTPGGGELVVVEDVTALRKMEEMVAREEKFAGVGRLAAGLAHELRNPLASLSGAVQLLRADVGQDGHTELYDIVLREVTRLNELVGDLFDTTRPLDLRLRPTDVASLIREVVQAFENDPRYRDRMTVFLDFGDMVDVQVDVGRMRQVLWNLLLNAAQAQPAGGAIEVRARVDLHLLTIEVSDDGVGIATDDLSRIFDPFYTTRAGGTGLGLANVDRIVRGHGGHIEVESAPGEGTTFRIRVPLGHAAGAVE